MDRFLYNDTVLRIFALILACAIWLGVNAPGSSQATSTHLSQPYAFFVKVEAPAGLVATDVAPAFADVIVTGDAAGLSVIQNEMSRVSIVADASALPVGRHTVRLRAVGMPVVSYTLEPQAVTVVLKTFATNP